MLDTLSSPFLHSSDEHARKKADIHFVPQWQSSQGISHWHMHLPMGYDLVGLLRPKVLVELGVDYGDSYFNFCQSVLDNKLDCICYGVDTWLGDIHTGARDQAQFLEVNSFNSQRFSKFSYLLRMTFDNALSQFADNSIDLLHIDGAHRYEAVRSDFDSWLPKVRPGGIILLHDICVRFPQFGVWQLWDEIKADFEFLEIPFGHGLGILRVGNMQEENKQRSLIQFILPEIQDPSPQTVVEYYSRRAKGLSELFLAQNEGRNNFIHEKDGPIGIESQQRASWKYSVGAAELLEERDRLIEQSADRAKHLRHFELQHHILNEEKLALERENEELRGKLQGKFEDLDEKVLELLQLKNHRSLLLRATDMSAERRHTLAWLVQGTFRRIERLASRATWKLERALGNYTPYLRAQQKGWTYTLTDYAIGFTAPEGERLSYLSQEFAGQCTATAGQEVLAIRARLGEKTVLADCTRGLSADSRSQLNFTLRFAQLGVGWNKIRFDVLNEAGRWIEIGSYLGFMMDPAELKRAKLESHAMCAPDNSTATPVSPHLADSAFKDFDDLDAIETSRCIQHAYEHANHFQTIAANPVKTIAFYLPQFHPIPENNAWWGKGFTEWTNTSRAPKLFNSHYQPRLPTELGFYDLRLPEIRKEQAELARQYGISGFCYHYYWFAGKRVLHQPFDEMLALQEPDFPFCISWANEHWTRTWDGNPDKVLFKQEHSLEDSRNFIEHLLPALRDDRYIRVNGKAILMVYNLSLMPDPRGTAELWREVAQRNGAGDLLLCACRSFSNGDPRDYGFDTLVDFPPHGSEGAQAEHSPASLSGQFTGRLFDVRRIVEASLAETITQGRIRTVIPSWDNTARKKYASYIGLHSSPELYQAWLSASIAEAASRPSAEERLVFINAWNEWAEGCYLEPDEKYGRQYLEATQAAVTEFSAKSTAEISPGIRVSSSAADTSEFTSAFASHSDEQWLAALINAIRDPHIEGVRLPSLPDPKVQESIVAASNEEALNAAYAFYKTIKDSLESYGKALCRSTTLLDFGTGFGRTLRFFLKDIDHANLFGIDVDPQYVDICRRDFQCAKFLTCEPTPPSQFTNEYFDIITSYSVYSHLNRDSADAWIAEFSRILKPGGYAFLTTLQPAFIDACETIRRSGGYGRDIDHNLQDVFYESDKWWEAFNRGEFLHHPQFAGEGREAERYGYSIIPRSYAEHAWCDHFELVDWLGSDTSFYGGQVIMVLKKRERSIREAGANSSFSDLTEEQWIDLLVNSATQRSKPRTESLPEFPIKDIQIATIGSSGETPIREVAPFFKLTTESMRKQSEALSSHSRILDFGCAWARILRFYLHTTPAQNLFGTDVWQEMIETSKQIFPEANFLVNDVLPSGQFREGYFDLVVSYSIFSHINESVATAWAKEFSRILRPGGLFCFTTQKRSFIDYCEQLRQTGELSHVWHENLVRCWIDTETAHQDFTDGVYLHEATGGGELLSSSFYGESIIPPSFVTSQWSNEFELLEYADSNQVAQAVYILRKR